MEIPTLLAENTARMHGANDLAGGLARDLVATRAALLAVTPFHRARGCWCGSGRDIDNYGHENGCKAARAALGITDRHASGVLKGRL